LDKHHRIVNTYHIQYHGLLAERRGVSAESLQHPAQTPAGIYQALLGGCGGLSRDSMRAVVNDTFVAWDHPLQDEDRIAFLPPMSGG
jgi:molybdopterin synthase sulfur carrier subunit